MSKLQGSNLTTTLWNSCTVYHNSMEWSTLKQLEEMAIIILTVTGLCHLKKCLGANLVREQGKCELCLLNLCGMHSAMLPTKGKR